MVFLVLDEMTVLILNITVMNEMLHLILNITVMNEMLHFVYKFYTLHLMVEEFRGFNYLLWKCTLHITRTVQEYSAEVSLVSISIYSCS